jgi:hypothetical protein
MSLLEGHEDPGPWRLQVDDGEGNDIDIFSCKMNATKRNNALDNVCFA